MKRLFIAIPTSAEIHQLVSQISADLTALKNDVRLVRPENAHITIKFLGETEESVIPGIVGAIHSVSSITDPFDFLCEGTGVFPSKDKPRVLWLGISQGVEQFRRLSSLLDDALFKTGIPKEKREFSAHLTIGRIKNEKAKIDGLRDFLAYSFSPIHQIADRLHLLESELLPRGPVYTPIEAFIFRK
ncbi:MAG: RNA 2',3'-cyclic phosphodiesterase [Candidatus Neomarinimicrobiota bacterium]